MKRFISILCVIALMVSITCFASAEISRKGINILFATASDEDLQLAIEYIQEEQNSRGTPGTKSNASNENNNGKGDLGKTLTNSNGVSLTVLSFKESKGSSYAKPESGNTFLLVELQIENNSNDVISINNTFGFDAVCDDYSVDYSFSAEMATDKGLSSTDLKPGRKIKGWKAYEVPKDWKELIVTFTPNVSLLVGD